MAASGRHVGHHIQRNGRFLLNNWDQLWGHRTFAWTPALQQQAAEASKETTDNIVIPRKKTWSKEAVLKALASTVSRDHTAYAYPFQDDPYLAPMNSLEFKFYLLSQESGRSAAKFFVNSNPKLFTKDYAEPHIPCLMPETLSLRIEEVSEEALKERISLRKVSAAVDMYDQLLQSGTAVSLETTSDLLDLICLYCDKDPVQDWESKTEDLGSDEMGKRRRFRIRPALEVLKSTWKENDNNAERIFNLLPERNTRCYSAMIRGMVKHGAPAKAFSMYTDMLNNRLTGDVHIFNALISAAPDIKEKYGERWSMILELLTQMSQQKVQPNLMTFNNVLKALRRCGNLGQNKSLQVLSEMKALGIAPSLASYNHILALFYKGGPTSQSNTYILQEIISELEGKSFTCRDPDDVIFFSTAVKICLHHKDLELGYKIQSLAEVENNWRMLGEPYQQSIYYGRFFNLLCVMEHTDVVLQWYRRLIPSLYYPNSQGLKDLLQALDTDNRLDLLPEIWKDIKSQGQDNAPDLVEEVLILMARETHSPEVQESFAACALDIKNVFAGERGRFALEWSTVALSNVTSLLLRSNKTQQAWEMLLLFKSKNRVPSEKLLNEFLSACHRERSPKRAVELVQLSASFFLPETPQLATRVLAEFDLTEKQRSILSELESARESSD